VLNHGFEYRERIPRSAAGVTVLRYLGTHYDHSTVDEWSQRLGAGLVFIDGIAAVATHPLEEGQTLTWFRPPWHEPDVPRRYGIAYRDRDLLALVKPAGLPTLPGAGFLENTLLAVVRRDDPLAVPMHRLGRWTSGLVLFARTGLARAGLAELFRSGRIEKHYRCVASGTPGQTRGSIETPIGRVPYPPLGQLWAACENGKRAHSTVEVRRTGTSRFLADVQIFTGRPHQIRIHLAAWGHPLVGDPLYTVGGVPYHGGTALPGDPGYQLHATRLRLPHPTHGGVVELRSAAPFDLIADAD
jgi:23S rRNA pseudouridine1911/1915/1917 synthase